jgi:hypothetical protein
MGFIYLASPYTDDDPDVRQRRFEVVCRVAGELMEEGHIVFSAIAHGHSVETIGMEGPAGHDFWMRQCVGMLERAEKLVVLTLDGWEVSRGVQEEIEFALRRGIPTEYRPATQAVYVRN